MNKSAYLHFLPAKKEEGVCSTLIIGHASKDFGEYHQITEGFGEYGTRKTILPDFHNGVKYLG